jgi:ABC-type nickel/cobalt efflux system permease component RcnA
MIIEFLKLIRDAVKVFILFALLALLIGIVVATDPGHAFSVEDRK